MTSTNKLHSRGNYVRINFTDIVEIMATAMLIKAWKKFQQRQRQKIVWPQKRTCNTSFPTAPNQINSFSSLLSTAQLEIQHRLIRFMVYGCVCVSERERKSYRGKALHKPARVWASFIHDQDCVFKTAGMRCSSLIITGCLVLYCLHNTPEARATPLHTGPSILALVSGKNMVASQAKNKEWSLLDILSTIFYLEKRHPFSHN